MSLEDRLFEDLKDAMRQGDELRRSTLRMVRAAIQNEEIAQGKRLDDAGVINVLQRLGRQHQESISQFQQGNRPDLVAKEEAELAILQEYLPQQMSRDDIVAEARKIIEAAGAKGPGDKGKVMPKIIAALKGKADGREINEVVTDLLKG